MTSVTVVDHPLVQHKLTPDARQATARPRISAQLLNEIGMLICYEVTRDLPLEQVEIETPLQPMMAPKIAGKKLVFAPDPARRHGLSGRHAGPGAVGARGAYRPLPRSQDAGGVEYYFKAPTTSPTGW